MTTVPYNETAGTLGLAKLEEQLQIGRSRSVAVINAPLESGLRLLATSRTNPDTADVVIAFATRRVELAFLRAAYRAACSGRVGWIVYPEPGRPGTDLRWEWFLAALRQYGVQAVEQVPIDSRWSAVLLRRIHNAVPEEDLVGYPAA